MWLLPLIDIRHFLSCWDKTSLFTFWFSFLLTFTLLTFFLINLLLQINLAKMRNRGSISLKLVAKLMVKAGFNHIITVDMHSKGTIHTIAFFNLIIFYNHKVHICAYCEMATKNWQNLPLLFNINYLLGNVKTKQIFSFQLLQIS